MRLKFGAIVVAGSGKIGGHVVAKGRSGSYMRTKVKPVNPKTTKQITVRSFLTTLSQAWKSLTTAQLLAWNTAVASYQKHNKFGDLVKPSGFNLYIGLNRNLKDVNVAIINTPATPAAVPSMATFAPTSATGTPALSLVFTPTVPAATAFKVFATVGMSAGKSYVKNQFRQITVLPATTVSPFNALAAYTAVFGSIPAIGQKFFIKVVPVNTTTGQSGAPSQVALVNAS
jgi:hypothetical protein